MDWAHLREWNRGKTILTGTTTTGGADRSLIEATFSLIVLIFHFLNRKKALLNEVGKSARKSDPTV